MSTTSARVFAFANVSCIALVASYIDVTREGGDSFSVEFAGPFGDCPEDWGMRSRIAFNFRRKGISRPSDSMLENSVARASCSKFGQLWTSRAIIPVERGHFDGRRRWRNVAP